jgi:hypothetical protein
MRLCLGLRGEHRSSREGQDQGEHGIALLNEIPIRFVPMRLPDSDQIEKRFIGCTAALC